MTIRTQGMRRSRAVRRLGGLGVVLVIASIWIALCLVVFAVAAVLVARLNGTLAIGLLLLGAVVAFIGVFPISLQTVRRLRRSGLRALLSGRVAKISGAAASALLIVAIVLALLPAPVIWQSGTLIDTSDGGGLQSLSCANAHFCVTFDWNGHPFVWNGDAWTESQVDLVHNFDEPLDLSCGSAKFCEVVNDVGQLMMFDGTSNRWVNLPANSPSISSISCVSRQFCVAVGSDGVFDFDGMHWTRRLPGADLAVVACASPTFCVAMGAGAAIFNGRSWKLGSLASANLADTSQLSCVQNSCVAITLDGSSFEYENGTWRAIGATGAGNQNTGYTPKMLSCTSVGHCYFAATSGVIYELDGTRWSSIGYLFRESWLRRLFEELAPTPAVSLSCPQLNLCVAVDGGGIAYVDHLKASR